MQTQETQFKVGEPIQPTRTRTWMLFVLFGIISVSLLGML